MLPLPSRIQYCVLTSVFHYFNMTTTATLGGLHAWLSNLSEKITVVEPHPQHNCIFPLWPTVFNFQAAFWRSAIRQKNKKIPPCCVGSKHSGRLVRDNCLKTIIVDFHDVPLFYAWTWNYIIQSARTAKLILSWSQVVIFA